MVRKGLCSVPVGILPTGTAGLFNGVLRGAATVTEATAFRASERRSFSVVRTSPIDSVGGYMLVSKAKPCMSKFK